MALALVTAFVFAAAHATHAEKEPNPLMSVDRLLSDLAANIEKDGEEHTRAYQKFAAWCKEASQQKQFETKTSTAQKAKLDAKIAQLSDNIEVAGSRIEELAGAGSKNQRELEGATAVRKKEADDFASSEEELTQVVSALERAITVLEREAQKNPAVFAQFSTASFDGLLQSLGAVVDAASLSSEDEQRLVALVQSQQAANDEDEELGAPASAVYKSHSGTIVEVLEDLKEKAESQLRAARKAETSSRHKYQMLQQSLQDLMTADAKDLDEEKKGLAAAKEAQASAKGELESVARALKDGQGGIEDVQTSCLQTAADHEVTVRSRAEELKVITQAREILKSTTSGAAEQAYSFLQVASGTKERSRADISMMVQKLARMHHSAALAQLASRIAEVSSYSVAHGTNPFEKVKQMIQDLINRLTAEAQSDATEKAYCDEEMAKTMARLEELDENKASTQAKLDQGMSKSARLKQQTSELQAELMELAKLQAELNQARQEGHAEYLRATQHLSDGLQGVRKAMNLLSRYYGDEAVDATAMLQDYDSAGRNAGMQPAPAQPDKYEKSTGAGRSIIGILEVVESDLAASLAKEETEESDAQAEHDKTTQENEVTQAMKEAEVKNKISQATSIDRSNDELSADFESVSTELAAVQEYNAKLKDRCVAKPEAYEERKRRREAEIAGLREALAALQGESGASFVQRRLRPTKSAGGVALSLGVALAH